MQLTQKDKPGQTAHIRLNIWWVCTYNGEKEESYRVVTCDDKSIEAVGS